MSSLLDLSRRLLALSQTGLHFTHEEYDRERYREMAQIAGEMLALESNLTPDQLRAAWLVEDGYATPKCDVRGAVFRGDQVLMVKERIDGKWTLPGGWADVNDTPSHAVEKEIEQESGFTARAVKLATVFDRNSTSYETTAVQFFPIDKLPELSTGRTTEEQIRRVYEHYLNPSLPTEFD
jgi:ADP-ribose pyrophosphatase YjhB (NUDIX family)